MTSGELEKVAVLEAAYDLCRALEALAFFPASDSHAWLAVQVLVARMCGSVDRVEWLRDQVLQQWAKWEGPGALRELFSERFKPVDDKPAAREYEQLPAPRYREIRNGNGDVLGVQLLSGPAPRTLLSAPETDARAELKQLVGRLTVDAKPLSHSIELVPANRECTRCAGTGWLDASAGIRCSCVFPSRLQPQHQQKIAALEGQLIEQVGVDRRELAQLEAELEAAKTKKRTKQEQAARVSELKAAFLKLHPDYREPNEGKHREVVVGSEAYLVQ